MAKRKKNRTNSALWYLAFLGLAVLAGLVAYVKFYPADKVPPDLARQNPRNPNSVEPGPPQGDVKVLTPSYKDGDLEFKSESKAPGGENPMVFAVNRFLEQSKVAGPEARLLTVEVKAHVADLSFNRAFEQTYGTEDERTLLEGIQRTMGQFKDVDKVRLLVEGRPIDTLGNVELTDPIPVIR